MEREVFKMSRTYFEVGHHAIKNYPPVKVTVTSEGIKWNNELVYPEYVLKELLDLGFTDYEKGELKKSSGKLQRVIQGAPSKRSTWLDSWNFYEFSFKKQLDSQELLDYINSHYSVLFVPTEGGAKALILSYDYEKFLNDKKVSKYLGDSKIYQFGKIETSKRTIKKPVR